MDLETLEFENDEAHAFYYLPINTQCAIFMANDKFEPFANNFSLLVAQSSINEDCGALIAYNLYDLSSLQGFCNSKRKLTERYNYLKTRAEKYSDVTLIWEGKIYGYQQFGLYAAWLN